MAHLWAMEEHSCQFLSNSNTSFMATWHLTASQNYAQSSPLIGALAFSSFSLSTTTKIWLSGLGRSKRLSSGSKLFPLTLKLRFTAARIACESDLFIHRPYTKDVISPMLTALILLVYSSFGLLKCSCGRSLTGCMGHYYSKEKLRQ